MNLEKYKIVSMSHKTISYIFVNKSDLFVLLIVIVYAIYFSAFTVSRHFAFMTQSYDLSVFTQALWNTINGNILGITVHPPFNNFLQVHFAPSLLLIAPIYYLWKSPILLLVIQSCIIASGAYPIYKLSSKDHNNSSMGIVFAVAYLFFPAIQAANLYDFHGITLAAPLLAWTWYFASNNYWKRYAVTGVVSLGFREEAVIVLMGMAILLIVKNISKKWGYRTLVYCFLWLSLVYVISFPVNGSSTNAHNHFKNRFDLGDTPTEAINLMVSSPELLTQRIFTTEKIYYLINIFATTGFLSIFAWESIVLLGPYLFLNLMSTFLLYYSPAQAHYNAILATFIVITASIGAKNLIGLMIRNSLEKINLVKFTISIFVIMLSIGYQFRVAHLPFSSYFKWPVITNREIIGDKIARSIPQDASLLVQDHLAPHTSNREELFIIPQKVDADFIFFDSYSNFLQPSINDLLNDGYSVVLNSNGYILLRKGGLY